MRTNWKAGLLAAAAAMACTAAQAVPWTWTGTVASWAAFGATGITDTDGDMRFIWNPLVTTLVPSATTVTISESNLGGSSFYDVGFDFSPLGLSGPAEINYIVQSIDGSQRLSAAMLSVTQTGFVPAGSVVEELHGYGSDSDIFATLGVPPSPDMVWFDPRATIYVKNTISELEFGRVQDIHNGFLPEPGSLALVGLGLLVVPLVRRPGR